MIASSVVRQPVGTMVRQTWRPGEIELMQ